MGEGSESDPAGPGCKFRGASGGAGFSLRRAAGQGGPRGQLTALCFGVLLGPRLTDGAEKKGPPKGPQRDFSRLAEVRTAAARQPPGGRAGSRPKQNESDGTSGERARSGEGDGRKQRNDGTRETPPKQAPGANGGQAPPARHRGTPMEAPERQRPLPERSGGAPQGPGLRRAL